MTLLRDGRLAAAFDHGAPRYDALVAANPGYHRELRRSARRLGLPDGGAGLRVLDLGCGTGASTAALVAAAPRARVVAVDASEGMLRRARAKRWPAGVDFVHAPAEALARAGVAGPFDAVLASYLLRNVTDPDRVLAAVHGVLAPGGRLAVHDYALSGRRADRAVWNAVCGGVVQPAGTLLGDRALYRHLRRSVLDFDTASALAQRLRRAGFERVRVLPVAGWQSGIVHTLVGRRPLAGDPAAGGHVTRGPGADRRGPGGPPIAGGPAADGPPAHRPTDDGCPTDRGAR